ncbi:MAG: hypothetical protein ACW98D_00005 [Promethearchaeota archaeon]|jgi:hypothetical protein
MLNNSKKIRTIEDVKLILSLKSSWGYDEFMNEFGININDIRGFDDLFCIADQQIHKYADADIYQIVEFTHFLNSKLDPPKLNQEEDFGIWFSKFIKEKGLDSTIFEFETKEKWNIFPLSVLYEYVIHLPSYFQTRVKQTLIQLDLSNGNIRQFLKEFTILMAKLIKSLE